MRRTALGGPKRLPVGSRGVDDRVPTYQPLVPDGRIGQVAISHRFGLAVLRIGSSHNGDYDGAPLAGDAPVCDNGLALVLEESPRGLSRRLAAGREALPYAAIAVETEPER
jgi:hypothetical protein